jgi:hypothetical protein
MERLLLCLRYHESQRDAKHNRKNIKENFSQRSSVINGTPLQSISLMNFPRTRKKGTRLLTKLGILGIVGAALIVAACGGGSDENGAEPTQQPTSGGNSNQEVGKEEFGMTEEQLVTAIEDTEAAIADCMDVEGFEYIPIDPVSFRNLMASLASVPGLSDEEFVAQYGYGFTTQPPKETFQFGDENKAVFDSLSDSDKVSYLRALLGDNTQATFVYMLENEDFEGAGGCTKEAIDQVFTAEQRNPNFQNPFDVLVAQDPRVIDATKNWSECMSEEGFDFESPEEAEDQIIARFDALIQGRDPATLEGSEKEELEQLQGEEKAIAAADLVCQEEFLVPVEEQVERDISGRN